MRPTPALRTGDVVFHTSTSSRSALIRKASSSPYSHVGLVEVADDGVFVIEAVQPVSRTPWKRWRARGVGGKVTVMRARDVSAEQLAQVVSAAKAELGKPYDARYRWDDERLYCSELVAKAFSRALGVSLGEQQTVASLNLSKADLELGRSLGVEPQQTLVTPASLAGDAQLELVHTDF
ncbi:MAG: YiiX/YebB-like N1pC/P60 family cysteine hydrolase [Myxococcaceae bacterium]|nr:YiiX/YebB-like N1pC/P60 family cysteine hydrolase [Myxococcaceae bacterium]